ncbi:MAG TPA: c-type cytochrome [Verrucomicrobiae bacterium]|jgi:mono/diheme cytochrome c family protein|nr:c-type cytochrome [Verrucomicrobiae bacterium]
MWKGFFLGIVATIVVALAAGYIGIVTGTLIPANADARPSRLERWASNASLHASLNRDVPGLQNPLQANAANELAGAKLFGQNCAACHGDSSGRPTVIAFGMYQRAPTLGRRGLTDEPDAETYWKMTHGIRLTGMPSFVKTLDDTQRWQIATFLKHMDTLAPAAQTAWKKVHVQAVPAALIPRRGGPGGPEGGGDLQPSPPPG